LTHRQQPQQFLLVSDSLLLGPARLAQHCKVILICAFDQKQHLVASCGEALETTQIAEEIVEFATNAGGDYLLVAT
jgi:hypothetical protein